MRGRAALVLATPLALLAAAALQTCASTHRAAPAHLYIDPAGAPVRMIPFRRPAQANRQVSDWLRVALVELWSYSYRDYDEHLLRVGGGILSPAALVSFEAANGGFVEGLRRVRGWTSFVALGEPLLLDRKSQVNQIEEWLFEVVGQWQISRRDAAPQVHDMVLHVRVASDPAAGHELRITAMDLRSNDRRT